MTSFWLLQMTKILSPKFPGFPEDRRCVAAADFVLLPKDVAGFSVECGEAVGQQYGCVIDNKKG